MRALLSLAGAIARFIYRFIFGDDWTVAMAMVLGLAATGLLAARGVQVWWLVPLLAIGMTGVSLSRRHHPRRAER
jgi:hypothetical protein